MIILIPMAGESSRFFNKGYDVPKFMLPYKGRTVFDECLESFRKYFSTAKFIFIIKENYDGQIFEVEKFVQEHCRSLVIKDSTIAKLESTTKGQAETVKIGLLALHLEKADEELMIFNIDTFRYHLDVPEYKWSALFDAYYDEEADEHKFSFALSSNEENPKQITMTAEKKKIGPWVSTGLYIFKSTAYFMNLYNKAVKDENYNFYISPLYNYTHNSYILECKKEDVIFSGTPDEYESLL